VRLRLETLARKTLPVKAELSGRPARGYRIQKVETTPSSVMVEGPANMVRRLEYVQTSKIDINGISGNIEKMAPLISPGEGAVKLNNDSAQVFITVSGDQEIRKEEQ
jgi:YbbR domain-containing protein